MIGDLEHLDDFTQLTLELSAIVHDIACPLCRIGMELLNDLFGLTS